MLFHATMATTRTNGTSSRWSRRRIRDMTRQPTTPVCNCARFSARLRYILGPMRRRRTSEPRSFLGKFLTRPLDAICLEAAQLARRPDLSVSHVYQLLRGDRSDPRRTNFQKLAGALGMTEAEM